MSDDYIKRDDTLKAMDTWDKFGCDGHGILVPYTEEYVPYVKFDDMMKAVEGQPSADVAPVRHGHWIIKCVRKYELSDGGTAYVPEYECSWCGFLTESYVRLDEPIMPEDADFPKYCEYCGARMDEGED